MSDLHRTYVYGHSDDIVATEGARNHELYVYGDEHLTVGEVRLYVTFNGEWEFKISSTGGSLQTKAMILPNEIIDKERFNNYTEVVVIEESYL